MLLVCSAVLGGSAGAASAAPRGVTVFLERNGTTVERRGGEVEIPRFGGGDRAWTSVVTCVKQQFAPFLIDIVEQQPARGDFITAVVGGRASLLGLDDRSTNGVGPYDGSVIPNAVVHIFSRVGTGERDTENLCAVTVHEVSHALGLDHTYKCGDVMSYFLDRCGPRRFLDVDAPCGEEGARECGDGEETQNSYRRVAAAVGLRSSDPRPAPEPAHKSPGGFDPWNGDDGDGDDGDGDGDEVSNEDEEYELDSDDSVEAEPEPAPVRQRQRRHQPEADPSCGRHGSSQQEQRPQSRRVIVWVRR